MRVNVAIDPWLHPGTGLVSLHALAAAPANEGHENSREKEGGADAKQIFDHALHNGLIVHHILK